MNIDANWKRPIRIVNVLTLKKGGSSLFVYDCESGALIRNITSVIIRVATNAFLEADTAFVNAQGIDEMIVLRDVEIDVRTYEASRDWEKLNAVQKMGMQTFRARVARELAEKAEAFYRLYPELRLTWNFTCDALLREVDGDAESTGESRGRHSERS